MAEVVELEGKMDVLKNDIKEMSNKTKSLERNAETEVLSDLKVIQNRMKTCKSQLETLMEWDQLCSSCQDALSNQDTEVLAPRFLLRRWLPRSSKT